MLAKNFSAERLMDDKRRHERVPLALFGTYTRADETVIPCLTTDVSGNGVALAAPDGGAPGEKVQLHLNGIGALEGEIVRSFDGGFAIALTITPERQAELAAKIRAIYENSALSLIETPMFAQDDPNGLRDAIRLDARLTHGARQLQGETSGRLRPGAQGAELEFRCVRKNQPV